MKTVQIDFSDIGDYEDFFQILKKELDLPPNFGDNLDALADSLGGAVALPLHLEFVEMSVDQLETFEDLILTLEEQEEENDEFTFSYFLEQFDDDDFD